MAVALAAMTQFSKRLDISARAVLLGLRQLASSREDRRWPTRDGIWSRGGVPVEELPDPFAPATAGPSRPLELTKGPASQSASRRWPLVLYSIAGLLLITLIWLVITAPLSRALEPLDDPALLVL